jgi:hypothetical protein
MTVSVLVPWRAGCPHREKAWHWVQARYAVEHPTWGIITGACADGPYNRAEAILDAASRSSSDILVVADADVYVDPGPAVEHAVEHGWAIPHTLIHRLSRESTDQLLASDDPEWRRLELSTDNKQDSRPYKGHETGTLVVLRRDVLVEVAPDVRFVGWGQEDDAWALALNTLIGRPWRGTADLVHLWHPAPPRMSRGIGNKTGLALLARYRRARRQPDAMRLLLEEARRAEHHEARA